MNKLVTIKDKQFRPYIDEQQIASAVKKLAERINEELRNDFPFFLVVLNGSFMFASDLLKEVTVPCEISFIKLSSYSGTSSSGQVNELIGLKEDISGRTVVIVEDIVDSGATIERLMQQLKDRKVRKVKVATALYKPDACKKTLPLDYVGFEIPNDFVIGYGMDYAGMGRNLKEIHVLA